MNNWPQSPSLPLKSCIILPMLVWQNGMSSSQVIVNPRTGETIKVRMDLTNKVKALELLGKYSQALYRQV